MTDFLSELKRLSEAAKRNIWTQDEENPACRMASTDDVLQVGSEIRAMKSFLANRAERIAALVEAVDAYRKTLVTEEMKAGALHRLYEARDALNEGEAAN